MQFKKIQKKKANKKTIRLIKKSIAKIDFSAPRKKTKNINTKKSAPAQTLKYYNKRPYVK